MKEKKKEQSYGLYSIMVEGAEESENFLQKRERLGGKKRRERERENERGRTRERERERENERERTREGEREREREQERERETQATESMIGKWHRQTQKSVFC